MASSLTAQESRSFWSGRFTEALVFDAPEGFVLRSRAKQLSNFSVRVGSLTARTPAGDRVHCLIREPARTEREFFAKKLSESARLLSSWLEGSLTVDHVTLAHDAGIDLFESFHTTIPDEAALWQLAAMEIAADPVLLFRLYGIDPVSLSQSVSTDFTQLVSSRAPTLGEIIRTLAYDDVSGELPAQDEAEAYLHRVPYALLESRPDDFLDFLPEEMPLSKSKNFRKRFRREFKKIREAIERTLALVAKENAERKELEDDGSAQREAHERFVALLHLPTGLITSVRLQTVISENGADLRRVYAERLFSRSRLCLTNAEYERLEKPITPARESFALLSLPNAEASALTKDVEARRAVVRAAARLVLAGQIRPIVHRVEGVEDPAPRLAWLPALQNDGVKAVFQTLVAALSYRTGDLIDPETLPRAGLVAPDFSLNDDETPRVSAMENDRRVRAIVLLALSDAIKALLLAHSDESAIENLPTALLCGADTSVLDGMISDRPMRLMLAAFRAFELTNVYPWTPALVVTRLSRQKTQLTFGILDRSISHRDVKLDPKSRKEERDLHEAGRFGSSPVPLELLLTSDVWKTHRYAAYSALLSLVDTMPELSPLVAGDGSMSLEAAFLKTFFMEVAPQLAWLGIPLILPGKFKNLLRPRLIARIGSVPGGGVGSFLTSESLGEFRWEVAVGSRTMSLEELRRLMDEVGNVVPIDDDFVFLDPKILHDMESVVQKPTDAFERLRATLSGEWRGAIVLADDELRERMRKLTEVTDLPVPKTLKAELRPYQLRGYSWLMKNFRLGFGGLIADDMGLGKTLQSIAAMTALKESGELTKEKILCVVPMGVLTNWAREIERFSPALSVGLYHGLDRKLPEQLPDVTLTSYGTLRRDIERFKAIRWKLVVLDEAQAVKNPSAAQSGAVRELKTDFVIAMTGTPVENRLMEYWSILSVVMPGLLGTAADFQREYATPIEIDHDPARLDVFRKLTAPFMIRRVKSDKSIIRDLPEKNVIDRFTSITKEQAALYAKTLDESMKELRGLEGKSTLAQRRGVVLTLIMRLKQICNSPSQFLGSRTEKPDAGKGEALLEILAECRESERKVLIFTQFREMGERLQDWIEHATGERPDFLHGGVTRERRAEMTDRFQNDRAVRVMLVSLKAGGTGLNLTAASAVVHYDLWWNPAVEDQATDRAHRIGQRRDVLVYRFISAGTFEERINELLVKKRELTDLTVRSGENWIGDLSNDELDHLFRLSL